MNSYSSFRDELLEVNKDIGFLIARGKTLPGLSENPFREWENSRAEIHRQIAVETVRVAVVGAIKSGKSTFVNSLLKGDYLKRGAGVVTSIVTRIHGGERLGAKLYFKSWDEVNEDLAEAAVLFPSRNRSSKDTPLDIRRAKDREMLLEALGELGAESLFTSDARNANSVLVASYLKGYDRVRDLVTTETAVQEYSGSEFAKHRDFVGDDSLAVYLKDIRIEVTGDGLGENIEIADCQGSDSPNPLHLAMIQDYLLLTHLIIYVISSRTGLRRADIKFLSMIRKMGIMDNILFVINADLSEHESEKDLKALVARIIEELSLIKPEPEVYTVSALYDLFKALGDEISSRDRDRLDQWEKEPKLMEYCIGQSDEFQRAFSGKVTSERYFLLLKNHLERLDVIASGLANWIDASNGILHRDVESAGRIAEKIRHHQKGMDQVKSVIKNTLVGAVQKLKADLRKEVDSFFDPEYGPIIDRIKDHIRGYAISYDTDTRDLFAAGFTSALYQIYREFKQSLDFFMAETTNPEIMRFIKDREKQIKDALLLTAKPFDGLIMEALSEYDDTMESFGIHIDRRLGSLKFPDMDSVRNLAGLGLPSARATFRYSARIRSEAIMRLGVYRTSGFLRRIFRRRERDKTREAYAAIKHGVTRMKRETEKSIKSHFKDYRENIKFQYLFKLTDAVSNALYESLLDRFQAYFTDLSRLVERIGDSREDAADATRILDQMKQASAKIQDRIDKIRHEIRIGESNSSVEPEVDN